MAPWPPPTARPQRRRRLMRSVRQRLRTASFSEPRCLLASRDADRRTGVAEATAGGLEGEVPPLRCAVVMRRIEERGERLPRLERRADPVRAKHQSRATDAGTSGLEGQLQE